MAVKATTAADRFFCAFANPDDDGGRRGPVAALGDDPAMKQAHIQPDLLYCKQCRRHFRGKRRTCPNDGAALELVTAFLGQAGDVLDDRYVLVEQIGVGGMGCVYRAYDPQAGRHVALKLLRAEYASNATSAQRFLSEAKLVRLVNHPGVVQLHRFGRTEDGTLLIDMELVDGESVRDRLQRQGHGMDAVTAMQVLDQLLAALVACHDAGVIHCDVKPENLMVPRDGAYSPCKLVDFGIAQAAGPIVQSDDVGVVGTPAYMSPEQVRGGIVDARTDLYLVGCVTYELLTGEPPFVSNSPLELCQMQVLAEAPPLTDRIDASALPPGLEAWLRPLLAKDPAQRPASAREAREGLRAIRRAVRSQLLETAQSVGALTGEALTSALAWMSPQTITAEEVTATATAERPALRPPSAVGHARRVAQAATRPESSDDSHRDIHRLPVRESQENPNQASGKPQLAMGAVRALIEVRQTPDSGTRYGPEAIEQIARHVLQATIGDLRELGAEVRGPAGAHLEVRLRCQGDERGVVSHLLDTLADMQAQLGRIPEPALELRAAVVADLPGVDAIAGTSLDPLTLLRVSPLTQVRVDEHVARWAGRRPLVRLTAVPSGWRPQPTDIYATSLTSN